MALPGHGDGGHGRGAPDVDAQVLQSSLDAASRPGGAEHGRLPEPRHRVGARPPHAPQVLRDGRRPAQRHAGVLLRALWVAHVPQAPRGHPQRAPDRHVRPGGRPRPGLPAPFLPPAGAPAGLPRAHPARRLIGRGDIPERLSHPRGAALRVHAAHHVAGELGGAPVGLAPLRRRDSPGGEHLRVSGRGGGGIPQLPPLLSLGLLHQRARPLLQRNHLLHRHGRRAGPGLGPEEGLPRPREGAPLPHRGPVLDGRADRTF